MVLPVVPVVAGGMWAVSVTGQWTGTVAATHQESQESQVVTAEDHSADRLHQMPLWLWLGVFLSEQSVNMGKICTNMKVLNIHFH